MITLPAPNKLSLRKIREQITSCRLPADPAASASRVCAMWNILGPSWRTKLGAIVAAVSMLSVQAGYALDDKPETNPDVMLIVGTLGGLFALFSARDNVVSSEKAGVK